MKVKVKKFNEKAVLPFKKHESDFCYDLTATSCEEITPNVFRYGVGLGFQIERDENCPKDLLMDIDIRPRSSIYKTGMVLANSEPTVDELYNGEVFLVFYKVVEFGEPYKVGDRIAQMKLGGTRKLEFIEVEELDETERGDKGFGSTGR